MILPYFSRLHGDYWSIPTWRENRGLRGGLEALCLEKTCQGFLRLSFKMARCTICKKCGKIASNVILMSSCLILSSVAVSMNILVVALVYVPGLPPTYRTMFAETNVFLTNALACQVFRKTKFGIIRDDTLATGTVTNATQFIKSLPLPLRFSNRNQRHGQYGGGGKRGQDGYPGITTSDILSTHGGLSDSNLTGVVRSTVAMPDLNSDLSTVALQSDQILVEKTVEMESDYPSSSVEEFEMAQKAQYSV